jgi:hypothetical protein
MPRITNIEAGLQRDYANATQSRDALLALGRRPQAQLVMSEYHANFTYWHRTRQRALARVIREGELEDA